MIQYPVTHRELQEAIDKASQFLLESKRLGIAYGTGITEKHLEQLYKLQIVMLGKIELSK